MIIEGEVILGTFLGDTIGHFDGSLVVAVEEIDLEACDAHGRILLASFVELVIKHIEDGPKHQFHIALGCISDEFLETECRDHRQHIAHSRLVPTFVEHHKLDTVSRCKIDVITIGFHIDARLERHSCQVPIVPPVPCHLAGLDPRSVANAVVRSQGIDEIGDGHFAVITRNVENSPRESPRSLTFGDMITAFLHITHLAPGVISHFGRIGSKFGVKRTFLCLHKHTGISLDITLQQSHLGLAAIYRCRQESGAKLSLRQMCFVVEVLECHRIRLLLVGRIREPNLGITFERILRFLIIYNIRVRKATIETIGNTLIVGTERDTETRLEAQVQFIALHRETALAIKRRFDSFADLSTLYRLHLAGFDLRSIAQGQTYARLGKQGVVIVGQKETELSAIGLHLYVQSAIRRLQVITDCQQQDTEERK